MIVPDVNLLIYAHNAGARFHHESRMWWESAFAKELSIGLPWAVIFGFIRLVTHPSVLTDPISPAVALSHVRQWLGRDHVQILEPGPRHLDIVTELFDFAGVGGNLTTDIHLAAIAIEQRAELHSNDADFERFTGLRLHNPLAAARKRG